MPDVACDRCEARAPAIALCELGGRQWRLCDPCSSMVLALLDGRPVFARGSAVHDDTLGGALVDALIRDATGERG